MTGSFISRRIFSWYRDTYCVLLNSVYIIIFFTVVVQGLTVKPVYSWLEARKAARLKRNA